jgi:hypothetical protein
MMREKRNCREQYTQGERLAFHGQPPVVLSAKANPTEQQTQVESIAPGHWFENAPPIVTRERLSVCASCFGQAVVFNGFLQERRIAHVFPCRVLFSRPDKRVVSCTNRDRFQ